MKVNSYKFMELIKCYLSDCETVWSEVKQRTGVKTVSDWDNTELSTNGELAGEPAISYSFHSERPELKLTFADDHKSIDLIFHNNKLGAFDSQRLQLYVTEYNTHFQEYANAEVLEKAIVEVMQLKLIDSTDLDGVYRLHKGFLQSLLKF